MTEKNDERETDSRPDEVLIPGDEGLQEGDDDAVRAGEKKKGLLGRMIRSVFKALAYAVFLIAAVGLVVYGVESLAKHSLKRDRYGDMYPDDISLAKLDHTRPVSHYDYDFNPGVCIEENMLKGNRFEYANNAGFRDPRDIPLEKPEGEFRIFLTGGSTAYGLGAIGEAAPVSGWRSIEFRETISHSMEMILNATCPIPGKTIKVWNTAVWGYTYRHNLMRYLTKLRLYKPDLVVSLDGANEIQLISMLKKDWNYFREGQYSGVTDRIYRYDIPGLMSYLTLWFKNNTYVMTKLWSQRNLLQAVTTKLHQASLEDGTEANRAPEQLSMEESSTRAEANIATVVRTVENYHSILENDRVPHLFALQPWLYLSKKQLHEDEEKIAKMPGRRHYYGVPSDKMYALLIKRITESAREKKYFVVDFSQYFDDVSEWAFLDWCHLSASANYLLAKELSRIVKQHYFQRPLTKGDDVGTKDAYFYNYAGAAKVIYAPEPVETSEGLEQILQGYPAADRLYSSKEVGPKGRLEVVLDLGRSTPLSRLRIVWDDEETVPEEWVVEYSEDAQNWKQFVRGTKGQTDDYSWWPGFEYYAAEPVSIRYVRYRPIKTQIRSIRLRLLRVSR